LKRKRFGWDLLLWGSLGRHLDFEAFDSERGFGDFVICTDREVIHGR